MRALTLIVFLSAAIARAEPLAWARLGDPEGQRYADTPYHWLGDAPLYLEVAVPPQEGLVLDLLWGSKNDQRGATLKAGDQTVPLKAGGYDGFRWQRVPLPAAGPADHCELQLHAGAPKAAFFGAVRVMRAGDPVEAGLPPERTHLVTIAEPPPHLLDVWREALHDHDPDTWDRADLHGRQANEALKRCRGYVDGWLAHADPDSGLIPQNLGSGRHVWNGRNSAADNYAFMVLTCALTDRDRFGGRMLDMLRTEARLTNRVGALPDHYDFRTQSFHHNTPDITRLVFDGSEYVKDGLMPISEWLGRTPWSERMIAIVDSILEHAPFATPSGPIPSDNVEVNGEMMQVLSRLCFMQENPAYLDMACRIADYYLLGDHHPTRNATRLGLRDHNCELISGLTEVYAACHHRRPQSAAAYREPLEAVLDRILEIGVNEHGLMYDMVNPQTGEILRRNIGDNWGYNYNGFYTMFLLDGEQRYRDATRHALAGLKPHYWQFAWQGWGADGIADSVEGAINLLNREPDVPGVPEWIDANISRMLLLQKPDGVIEGWHGDGNYARTAILWALWKQQGVTIHPWRPDVCIGAVAQADGLALLIRSESDWQGRLVFDRPRHRTVMKLPIDYPRINQFPEWFTVPAESRWAVTVEDTAQALHGRDMVRGLQLAVPADTPLRVTVRRP